MRYALMRALDISNGPGFRVSLFVQGCKKHCEGCFNPETWDYQGGKLFDFNAQKRFLEAGADREIAGFSILGGEPLAQDLTVLTLVKKIKELYPKKTIWMWSGYTYEELSEHQLEVLKYVDVLVDGKFDQTQKCPNVRFKGSRNQRIIDVQKTLASGAVTLYEYT